MALKKLCNFRKLSGPILNPDKWTLIIAAAGKGSRLKWHQPKTLYPVAGKAILDYIFEFFTPFCANTILITSKAGESSIRAHLTPKKNISFVVQEQQIGMGDAVLTGLRTCATPYCACVWGDQPFFSISSIVAAYQALQEDTSLSLALPVCPRHPAYIHIQSDGDNKISYVLQKREGDIMPKSGISDCSMFFFRVQEMKKKLDEALRRGQLLGKNTKEHNFLPIFPLLDKTLMIPIPADEYSSGINTPEEAVILESLLQKNNLVS